MLHCVIVMVITVLHSKAHVVPTYFAPIFSQSECSHLCLYLLVKLVQHVPYFLLKRIQTCPDLIVVVLHTRVAIVAAWETNALIFRLEGVESSLVLAKNVDSVYVGFSSRASPA
jgi:hypothetical protein